MAKLGKNLDIQLLERNTKKVSVRKQQLFLQSSKSLGKMIFMS
jgi:hypothetical protein